jgi:hypothetical protein
MADPNSELSQILIAGEWVLSASADSVDVKDPARLQLIGRVPSCGAADVGRSLDAATAAAAVWARVPRAEKVQRLVAIGTQVRAHAKALAECLALESGKPLIEAYDCVRAVAERFETPESSVASQSLAPATVTVVLTPQSAPLLMLAYFVVPALMAGSAVVIKPPQACSLSTLLLGRLLQHLPGGVVSIVTGGAETAQQLLTASQVATVAFAGAAGIGRAIETAATGMGKGFWGELGSSDAVMVCADSSLDTVVPALIWARLRNAGRSCLAPKRIYLERSIADEFVLQAHLCLADIEFGDPMLSSTDVGPLASLEAIRRVEDQVAYSMKAGARLVVGGMRFRPAGLPGFFFQPTILTGVADTMRVMREEVLGPVLAIQVVDDMAAAITTLSAAGLGRRIGVFTQDMTRVADLSARVPACSVWVNQPLTDADVYGGTSRDAATTVAERRWPALGFPYKKRPVPDGASDDLTGQ